jgi:hypothetical protein
VIAVQTVLFLYESIGKLVSVYPSRRRVPGRPANLALHIAVLAGTGLQLLTIAVPALRRLLGLESLDPRALIVLGATVLVTWIAAAVVNALVHARRDEAAGPRRDRGVLRHAGAAR